MLCCGFTTLVLFAIILEISAEKKLCQSSAEVEECGRKCDKRLRKGVCVVAAGCYCFEDADFITFARCMCECKFDFDNACVHARCIPPAVKPIRLGDLHDEVCVRFGNISAKEERECVTTCRRVGSPFCFDSPVGCVCMTEKMEEEWEFCMCKHDGFNQSDEIFANALKQCFPQLIANKKPKTLADASQNSKLKRNKTVTVTQKEMLLTTNSSDTVTVTQDEMPLVTNSSDTVTVAQDEMLLATNSSGAVAVAQEEMPLTTNNSGAVAVAQDEMLLATNGSNSVTVSEDKMPLPMDTAGAVTVTHEKMPLKTNSSGAKACSTKVILLLIVAVRQLL